MLDLLPRRQDRKGIDLVRDCVHDQLLREIAVFEGVQALLTRTIEQGEEQLRYDWGK